MNMNSLVSPLLGLALLNTGCGKTEIEYRHSSKAKVVDASKPTEGGNHQRHEHAEANQTSFRFAVDGRTVEGPQNKQTVEVKSAPSTVIWPDPKAVVTVEVGTINIHVGDVHHHTHVNTTTIVHEAPQMTIIHEQIGETPQTKKSPLTAKNARCERLRQEYNLRQAEWEKLFK